MRFLPKLPAKILLQIETVDSTSSPQIQIADWLCGALGRYYEEKAFGKEFFTILKPALLKSEELFSHHWTKIWEK
jgi:disulfide oxidoreductase YuzD